MPCITSAVANPTMHNHTGMSTKGMNRLQERRLGWGGVCDVSHERVLTKEAIPPNRRDRLAYSFRVPDHESKATVDAV